MGRGRGKWVLILGEFRWGLGWIQIGWFGLAWWWCGGGVVVTVVGGVWSSWVTVVALFGYRWS